MSLAYRDQSLVITEHGLLVAYGQFAKQTGLIEAIAQVPFRMKTLDHSPADKVIELLCHILAGGMHINELATSAHPLVCDRVVAEAWGQQSFASASGVSQLLHSVSDHTVAALKGTLSQTIAPYRQRILREASPSWLVVDFDLTGLVVSDQARTYEQADFGYLGEISGVGRGYQFARAQLAGLRDVLALGGFLHPGHTVSPHCLRELVGLTEAQLGRPRRRVECVEARLSEAQQHIVRIDIELASLADKPKVQRRRKQLLGQRERREAQLGQLRPYRDQLAAENAANPNPRRIILRLDGGFGDSKLFAWLYEQGYDFVGRAHNQRVTERIRKEEGLHWEKVSKNGFIAQSGQTRIGECPYPMRLFACRQLRQGDRPEYWSTLVATADLDATRWPVRRVGVFYNGRQIMEAGIKESKGLFASRHLPTRHQAGIALYQELVLFAQNLIRWFRRQFLGQTVFAAARLKELVQIGARSRAQLITRQGVCLLCFLPHSPWQGLSLSLSHQFSYQLALPFLEEDMPGQGVP